MRVSPMSSFYERISSVVTKLFERRAISVALQPNSDLRENGLTSLDMVNLVLALESAFDVTIPDNAMVPENFQSLSTIESLLLALLSDRRPFFDRPDMQALSSA